MRLPGCIGEIEKPSPGKISGSSIVVDVVDQKIEQRKVRAPCSASKLGRFYATLSIRFLPASRIEPCWKYFRIQPDLRCYSKQELNQISFSKVIECDDLGSNVPLYQINQ